MTPSQAGFSPHAPSVTLPLRFMVTGMLALLTGVILLVLRPEMLATYHYNQYVIAATHLFVLGWICTIVMGAMYQLVPVALETRLYSERLAAWQFAFHLVGFTGMVWMFWTWNMKQVGHFGSVLTVGVGLFVYNIARTLLRVPRWNVIATAVASALGWLSLAVCAGLTIAVGKCSYESSSVLAPGNPFGALLHGLKSVATFTARFDQIGAMHAHAHLGAVGVFVMLIVGISYKLVPMFTLSEHPEPAARPCVGGLAECGPARLVRDHPAPPPLQVRLRPAGGRRPGVLRPRDDRHPARAQTPPAGLGPQVFPDRHQPPRAALRPRADPVVAGFAADHADRPAGEPLRVPGAGGRRLLRHHRHVL